MDGNERRLARDSRLLQYGAKPLPDSGRIVVTADEEYAAHFSGQVALLVFLNLLGRSSRAISIDLPSIPVLASLSSTRGDLRSQALAELYRADPHGSYDVGATSTAACRVHFGRRSEHMKVFGTGWNACVGDTSSLPDLDSMNPFGPALAAVIAATRLFVHRLKPPPGTFAVNTIDWSSAFAPDDAYALSPELGELWIVGVGSVGSAVLYFLSLATTRFTAQLFDHDRVEAHNITRSPIFTDADVGRHKVAAAGAFLRQLGVRHEQHAVALHDSSTWKGRPSGTPDILVSAANEYNVRDIIETSLPPIQLYGTTGRNWQAAVVRHVPLLDPCSLCLFPSGTFAPTECATDPSTDREVKASDASLPFLSFAAGLMASIELIKLAAEKRPSLRNRTLYFSRPEPRFVRADLTRRIGCTCTAANASAQRTMTKGSRYAHLLP